MLELTVEARKFHDGSIESEEIVGEKKVKRDFYAGLEKLGFELLSEKNQGFAVSREFFRKLKEEKGAHFAEAYERKLAETYFLLAKKVDNPTDVDEENFWWIRPQSPEKDDDLEEENEDEEEAPSSEVRDPSESRSILMPSRRRGRSRSRNNSGSNGENSLMGKSLTQPGKTRIKITPSREYTLDSRGNVLSWRKINSGGK